MNYPEFGLGMYLDRSAAESPTVNQLLSMATKDTKDAWYSMTLAYTDAQGDPRLLKSIANMYNDYFINSRLISSSKVFSDLTVSVRKVDSRNVLPVAPEEGILLSMMSILEPNDHVIVISPTYQSLYQHAIQFKCNVDYWRLELKDLKYNYNGICNSDIDGINRHTISEWSLSISKLKNIIKPGITKCISINFPHNPTGYILPQSLYVELIDICRKYDIWLFSDEIYTFLWDSDENNGNNGNNGNWLPAAQACIFY